MVTSDETRRLRFLVKTRPVGCDRGASFSRAFRGAYHATVVYGGYNKKGYSLSVFAFVFFFLKRWTILGPGTNMPQKTQLCSCRTSPSPTAVQRTLRPLSITLLCALPSSNLSSLLLVPVVKHAHRNVVPCSGTHFELAREQAFRLQLLAVKPRDVLPRSTLLTHRNTSKATTNKLNTSVRWASWATATKRRRCNATSNNPSSLVCAPGL